MNKRTEQAAAGINIARIGPGMMGSFHAPSVETQEANARLIASAPDLLAKLSELVQLLDDRADLRDEVQNAIDAARSVIARATGKE